MQSLILKPLLLLQQQNLSSAHDWIFEYIRFKWWEVFKNGTAKEEKDEEISY